MCWKKKRNEGWLLEFWPELPFIEMEKPAGQVDLGGKASLCASDIQEETESTAWIWRSGERSLSTGD